MLATSNIGTELDAYATNPRKANEDYELSDFNLNRALANRAHAFIQLNLRAESYAVEAVRRLRFGGVRGKTLSIPQFFTKVDGKAIALIRGQ